MTRLVLFDIDGTLLDAGGAGRRSLTRAIEESVGRTIGKQRVRDFAGRTDTAIVRTLLERIGIRDPDRALERRIFDGYIRHLEEALADGDPCRPLPGVPELIDALVKEPDYLVGLLTGNLEAAARMKLSRLGIDSAFGFGAFGGDDEDRDRLLPIARSRAEAHRGCTIGTGQVVVVGDTPLDIRCARAGGVAIVAVATGLFDATTLAEHRPDRLLNDLRDTGRVLAILRALSDPHPPRGHATAHRAG